jgi:hypothetical protein
MTEYTELERRGLRALDLLGVISMLLAKRKLDGPQRIEVMAEILDLVSPPPPQEDDERS